MTQIISVLFWIGVAGATVSTYLLITGSVVFDPSMLTASAIFVLASAVGGHLFLP